MGAGEAKVSKEVQKQACREKMRLLRNNRGMFKTMDGLRVVRAGLEAPGASDLIGIYSVVITPEMVGSMIGIAAVVEVKEPDWNGPTTETEEAQENFIFQVVKRGGIGFFLNDHTKLRDNLDEQIKRLTSNKVQHTV